MTGCHTDAYLLGPWGRSADLRWGHTAAGDATRQTESGWMEALCKGEKHALGWGVKWVNPKVLKSGIVIPHQTTFLLIGLSLRFHLKTARTVIRKQWGMFCAYVSATYRCRSKSRIRTLVHGGRQVCHTELGIVGQVGFGEAFTESVHAWRTERRTRMA